MQVTPDNFREFVGKGSVCECCGANLVVYPYNYNRTLASSLEKFVEMGGDGMVNKLGLSNNEFTNIWKLQYWGIIHQHTIDGVAITGSWFITDFGWDFVAGHASIKQKVFVFRNQVLVYDGEDVRYTDLCLPGQMTRGDYANAALSPDDFFKRFPFLQ